VPITSIDPQVLIEKCPQVKALIPPPENMMKWVERQFLGALVIENLETKNVFEFGTYEGYTTFILSKVNPDGHVYTLDLAEQQVHPEHPHQFVGHHYKSNKCTNVTQFLEHSYTFDPAKVPPCDLVLVDADHSYVSVLNDCKKALQMLRVGGILILHDFTADENALVLGPQYYVNANQDHDWFAVEGTGFVCRSKTEAEAIQC